MIGAHTLTIETQEIAEVIKKSIESTSTLLVDKIVDDIYDSLCTKFTEHFSHDNSMTYLYAISYEVRHIIKNLLAGDVDQIKQLDIVSEYTFDKLHEIRLKIWETCSKDIEQCIISEQNNKILKLEEQISYLRRRFDY